MEEKVNFLFIVIIFSLLVQGMGQCSLKDMSLKQTKVNKFVKNNNSNRPVWKVTITNNCYCSQSNIKIACTGVRTLKEAVDPPILKMEKGRGVVKNGEPIYPYTSVKFTYASSSPLQFKLLSSQVACS
ncbi:uncharacterized protein LOC110705478 [Chenopodium quinoa]|uniref:uncharacterized protein LOC110705478 n=1 Tax=Chenopodium quinoa TaxID=63459 RepID=UPI000B775CBC|nr:uncharacterized protein LOC110705478 [Chenopodium quinoa]